MADMMTDMGSSKPGAEPPPSDHLVSAEIEDPAAVTVGSLGGGIVDTDRDWNAVKHGFEELDARLSGRPIR